MPNEVSAMAKKVLEIGTMLPRSGCFDESLDIINLVTRKSLITSIYKYLFGSETFEKYTLNSNMDWVEFGDVHVYFEKNQKGFRFNKCSNYMVCLTETDTDIYKIIIPLFADNNELFLYGLLGLSEPTFMLEWSEYGFVIENKNTNKENRIHLKFSYSIEKGKNNVDKDISPQEYFVLSRLEDAALKVLSEINNDRLMNSGKLTQDFELLRIWSNMQIECYSANEIDIKKPARPIEIAPEWETFEGFKSWSYNNGFESEKLLIRSNHTIDFSPVNCSWGYKWLISPQRYYWHYFNHQYYSAIELSMTTVSIHGETKSIMEWSEISDIPTHVIMGRVYSGLKDDALLAPMTTQSVTYLNQEIEIDGEIKTAKEWATQYNITPNTIASRIRYGWTGKDLIAPPRSKARVSINAK